MHYFTEIEIRQLDWPYCSLIHSRFWFSFQYWETRKSRLFSC